MLLDAAPHVGDGALGGDAQHLREGEGRHRLHQRRRTGRHRQRHQPFHASLADHVVDQVLGGGGKHESGRAVDEHQPEAQGEPAAAGGDQRAGFLPRRRGQLLLLRFVGAGAEAAGRLSGRPLCGCRAAVPIVVIRR